MAFSVCTGRRFPVPLSRPARQFRAFQVTRHPDVGEEKVYRMSSRL
jgi:hypothetical protein